MTDALAAGGLVPASRDGADRVDALAFAHAALANRVVVRLVPSALTPGVVAEMDLLGFATVAHRDEIGYQRRRALGFPGWALVHDPERARFALDVMRQLKVHQKRIPTRPGNAKEGFQAIADDLAGKVPHFLPSFWEEVGRAFVDAGNPSVGATAFDKARMAEREHGLEVDDERLSEVYLEFSLAGALTVKALQGYAKELQKTHGPKGGYERFFELCVGRTLGGVALWASAQKDLRSAAKAAGLDADAEDDRLLKAVLGSGGFARSSAELLWGYEAALVRVCRDPAVRPRVLDIFPKLSSSADRLRWLALLDRARCFEAFERPRGELPEPSGGPAAWVGKALAHFAGPLPQFRWYTPDNRPPDDGTVSRALDGLSRRFAPRLAADGVPVDVFGNHWQIHGLDRIDLLLELGVPVGGGVQPHAVFDLSGGPDRRDPVLAAEHPVVGPVLRRTVARCLHEATFQAYAAGKRAYAGIRREWLERQISRLGGTVAALSGPMAALEAVPVAELWAEFPDCAAAWRAFDPVACLARSLRGGLLSELRWPALEAVVAEAGRALAVHVLQPVAVLTDGRRAWVLDARRPEDVLLKHDLRLPPTAHLQGFAFAGGQLYVAFIVPGAGFRAYWSGSPTDSAVDGGWAIGQPRAIAELPDGRISEGGRPYGPGDAVEPAGPVYWDAGGVWKMDPRQRRYVPADARGTPVPDFLAVGAQLEYHPASPDSPLGAVDGQYGMRALPVDGDPEIPGDFPRTMRVETLGGRAALTRSPILAFVTLPADERPRVAFDATHAPEPPCDGTGWQPVGPWMGEGPLATTMRGVPPSLWHALRPRDPRSSARLRSMSRSDAAALADDPAAVDGLGLDPVIAGEVTALCATLARRRKQHAALGLPARPVPSWPRFSTTEAEVDPAWGSLRAWPNAQGDLPGALNAICAGFGGVEGRIPMSRLGVHDWPGRIGGLAFLAVAPAVPKAAREAAVRLIEQIAATPLATGPIRHLVVRHDDTSPLAMYQKVGTTSWLLDAWVRVLDGRTYVCGRAIPHSAAVHVLELAPDGHFRLPAGVTVDAERAVAPADQAWIARFVSLARERGAIPDDPSIRDAIAAATGLTRTEAALVWAGMPGADSYEADFLGKERREALDVKLADAKAARGTLRAVPPGARLALYAAAIPDDPADLWRPLDTVVPRLCAAWNQMFGRRAPVPEALLAQAAHELPADLGLGAWLVALASVGSTPAFNVDLDWTMTPRGPTATGEGFNGAALRAAALLAPWVSAATPVGDPLRGNLPVLGERLDARLANPKLVLPVGTAYGETPSIRTFLAFVGHSGESTEVEGLVVAGTAGACSVGVRPGRWDEAQDLLRRVPELYDWPLPRAIDALRLVRSDGYRAILARSASTPVPPGRWEQDPRLSAPAVVASAKARLELDEDATTLYLQVLALHDPTKKNVLLWNGWKPADHARAEATLLARGLLVAGKRPRAGRDAFLPGGWVERNKGSLPVERWKLPMYGATADGRLPFDMIVPLSPIHEIFERAWDRVVRGDAPRYEEPG